MSTQGDMGRLVNALEESREVLGAIHRAKSRDLELTIKVFLKIMDDNRLVEVD